jgi:hypothetical protein
MYSKSYISLLQTSSYVTLGDSLAITTKNEFFINKDPPIS